jgi:transposase
MKCRFSSAASLPVLGAARHLRKSFHGLIALTESALKQDPLSGSLFVFFNRRRDRIKI